MLQSSDSVKRRRLKTNWASTLTALHFSDNWRNKLWLTFAPPLCGLSPGIPPVKVSPHCLHCSPLSFCSDALVCRLMSTPQEPLSKHKRREFFHESFMVGTKQNMRKQSTHRNSDQLAYLLRFSGQNDTGLGKNLPSAINSDKLSLVTI